MRKRMYRAIATGVFVTVASVVGVYGANFLAPIALLFPPWMFVATMIVVPLMVGIWAGFGSWRDGVATERTERKERGECVDCGYSLTGNTSGVCPECGTAMSVETDSIAD